MRIAFHINQLSERGCELALFDYCHYSQALLDHEPVVFYPRDSAANDALIIDRFSRHFDLVPYRHFSQVDDYIDQLDIDLFYAIKGGEVDGIYSRRVPTMIHAVFAQTPLELHGCSYAFVSEWLSRKCSLSLVPAVPHIVHPPSHVDPMSLRALLGIPDHATVFSCYGGENSFDIGFVRDQVIPSVLELRDDIYFTFMNFGCFIDHPRVFFLPKSTDLAFKQQFVAAADAMLHARRQGESFGLACAEFSAQGKPIFSYRDTPDRHHHYILSRSISLYAHSADLIDQLLAFDRNAAPPCGVRAYLERYQPEAVMESFDRYLIRPALRAGLAGTAFTVFTQPWRRPLSPWIRGGFWNLQIILRRLRKMLGLAFAMVRIK